MGWMVLSDKVVTRCTAIAPSANNLNQNLIFDQADCRVNAMDCAS